MEIHFVGWNVGQVCVNLLVSCTSCPVLDGHWEWQKNDAPWKKQSRRIEIKKQFITRYKSITSVINAKKKLLMRIEIKSSFSFPVLLLSCQILCPQGGRKCWHISPETFERNANLVRRYRFYYSSKYLMRLVDPPMLRLAWQSHRLRSSCQSNLPSDKPQQTARTGNYTPDY